MQCQVCRRLIKKGRPAQKFCNATCRSAAWRQEKAHGPASRLLAHLNALRAVQNAPPLLRDDEDLDSFARLGSLLGERYGRRYFLEARGEGAAEVNFPRMVQADLTHCGLDVRENKQGQLVVTILLVGSLGRVPVPPAAAPVPPAAAPAPPAAAPAPPAAAPAPPWPTG